MSTFTAHIPSRSLQRTLLFVAALAATIEVAGPRPASAASRFSPGNYGWPVAPFDRQHPVRGGFGDPRTLFSAPPTIDGVLHGACLCSFHDGVDISAPDGTAVYPVVSGTVVLVSSVKSEERVVVNAGDRRSFEYWHIRAAVHTGEQVTVDRTVLGRILRSSGHVHLTELDGTRITDPLLHLRPYRDVTKPAVGAIQLRGTSDGPQLANFVRGPVSLVAEAYDTATLPVPGSWRDMPISPALITWRVETWSGKVKVPTTIALDTRVTIPSNASFWSHYARGTFQNMAVFGSHYSFGQPGCFLFRLGTLDTSRLRDDVYRLVVTAADVQGNSSTASIRFTVHNHAGWAGV